ncbi:MAG: hypothetical protein NT051_05860 [Candidatus Micrarchaeota archaeon]|nr:hypothetical protein [Candidatus Micrarchaeota archaeon]
MDLKSLLAGVLLAFGVSNLLVVMGIPFGVPRDLVVVADMPIGTVVVALLSLGIAFYLIKKK